MHERFGHYYGCCARFGGRSYVVILYSKTTRYPSLKRIIEKSKKRGSIMDHDGTSGGVLFRVFMIE